MDYPVNGPQHVAIAAIQFNPRDDKIANIDKALSLIDQAASSGARLVVLPEIWTYMGDPDRNRENAEPIPGDLTMRLSERARRHGIYLHAGTFAERSRGMSGSATRRSSSIPKARSSPHTARSTCSTSHSMASRRTRNRRRCAPGDEIVTFDAGRRQVRAGDLLRPPLPGDLPDPRLARGRGDSAPGCLHDDDRQGSLGSPDPGPGDREPGLHGRRRTIRAELAGQVVLRADDDRRPVGHGGGHGA